MTGEWIGLGPADVEENTPVLARGEDGRRYLVVRRGADVHVLDNRCPHEGYPLSDGYIGASGELTCAWHNWKFDVRDGRCTSGGDSVRVYPCRVRDGRVEADVSIDAEAERARAAAGLREALFEGDASRALRDALRIASLDGVAPFEAIVRDVALRSEYGFGHILASAADVLRFSRDGDVETADAVALLTSITSEVLAREPVRAAAEATSADAAALDLALEEERVADAEGAVRALARSRGAVAAIDAMLPFATRHLLSYGHGLIYLAKARELAAAFEAGGEEIAASLAVSLAWSTRESSLPPFRTTQKAVAEARAGGDRALADRPAFVERVLESERSAVEATLRELASGVSARALLLAIARAAAERLRRFDPRWTLRHDMDAGAARRHAPRDVCGVGDRVRAGARSSRGRARGGARRGLRRQAPPGRPRGGATAHR